MQTAPAASVSAVLHIAALVALCCVIVRPPPPPRDVAPSFAMVMAPPPSPFVEQALPATRLSPAAESTAASLATPLHLSHSEAPQSVSRAPLLSHLSAKPAQQIATAPALPAAQPPPATEPAAQTILAGLEYRIRQAVQAALIYPAAARIMHREGRTRIRFDYTDGTVGNTDIATSSTSALLDRAALDAIHRAALPRAPAEIGNRRLTMLVWVDFRLASQ